MLTIPTLFALVFQSSNKSVWSDAKKVSMGLTSVLHQDAQAYISDTDFNKYFTGKNKGRTLYGIVQDEINEKGFSVYVHEAEKRLLDLNFKQTKFELESVLDAFYQALETSQNLPKDTLLGLKHSYQLNCEVRPYLFLTECLFYALACSHNPHSHYTEIDSTKEIAVVSNPLEELITSSNYPRRIIQELNLLSEEEIELFKKVAPYTFYDESFDYLSGGFVLDRYLISHEDFFELYSDYHVTAKDITDLMNARLINGGGKHELVVKKDELAGFQNDNLVLALTTDSEQEVIVKYKAFHLTDTANALAEILEIETDDGFFRALAKKFGDKMNDKNIKIETLSIKELEDANGVEKYEM